MPGSRVVHVMRQFGCFWTYFTHFLREGGNSEPPSCSPASRCEKCAQSMLQLHTELVPRGNLTCLHEPRVSDRQLSSVRAFPQKSFWEPSMTRSCELSKARGWRERRESHSQVFCHPNKVHARAVVGTNSSLLMSRQNHKHHPRQPPQITQRTQAFLSKLVAHRPVVTRGTNPSGWPLC